MINLLPPDYKDDIRYGRRNRKMLSWSTTVAFGILSLLVVTFVGKATIESAKGQAVAQKNAIEDQIKQTRLIRKLATLLPPGSRITNISLTDKDKALTLNFSNDRDGLGPVILTNLLNQGEQVATKSKSLVSGPFGLNVGFNTVPNQDGTITEKISTDPKAKQLEYFIEVGDTVSEQAKLTTFTNALKNGGEFSYELVRPAMNENHLSDASTSPQTPQFTAYTIDTQARSVDFSFKANSASDVQNQLKIFSDNPNSAFIETYLFEDKDYMFTHHCQGADHKKTCEAICNNASTTCDADQKVCHPLINKGCSYIIRGYYDELYTTASIVPTSSKEKATCQSNRQRPCTHKITAKYNQLFDNVDINKTSACVADSSGALKCPVDLRAQFSSDAKFYFVNSTGATQ
jgi:hypothetical protein